MKEPKISHRRQSEVHEDSETYRLLKNRLHPTFILENPFNHKTLDIALAPGVWMLYESEPFFALYPEDGGEYQNLTREVFISFVRACTF